jgi:hypothetical protein
MKGAAPETAPPFFLPGGAASDRMGRRPCSA